MSVLHKTIKNVLAVFLALLALIPFYFLLVTGLSRPTWHNLFVPELYFENLVQAWEKSKLGTAMLNSAIITFFSVVLIVLLSASAGFAFARVRNKFNRAIYYLFLFSMMIPAIINTVPLYILMKKINGVNTHWAMILLLTTGAIPFASFLYTSFIESMTREIEESAYIEGCTWFMAFWKVVFPLLKPVTSSVIIINAIGIWNNYGSAVFFLQKPQMRTMPLAVSSFVQTYGANWNLMGAAALIGLIPSVLVFLCFQKYFIKGMAAGAMKG